jgi:hypothetical protein
MIDPLRITNFSLSKYQLEEYLLFWITAAGKSAISSARGLEKFLLRGECLCRMRRRRPFETIQRIGKSVLPKMMRESGIGCYNQKARSFWELATSALDLATCTTDDLEQIIGIGPKTSRCFIMHSRPNQRLAGLDTHILKFMRDMGYDVPKSTPSGKKYLELEKQFLELADKSGKGLAEFDLEIWKRYSQRTTVLQIK